MNIDFCMRLCEFVFLFHLDKNLKHGFVVFFFFFFFFFPYRVPSNIFAPKFAR